MVKSSEHDNFEDTEPEFQNDGTADMDYRDDDIAEINEPGFTQDAQLSQMSDLGSIGALLYIEFYTAALLMKASVGEPEPRTKQTSATSDDDDDDDDDDDSGLDSPGSDAYAVKSGKDMKAGLRTPKRPTQQAR
jgi:hypothetical protein